MIEQKRGDTVVRTAPTDAGCREHHRDRVAAALPRDAAQLDRPGLQRLAVLESRPTYPRAGHRRSCVGGERSGIVLAPSGKELPHCLIVLAPRVRNRVETAAPESDRQGGRDADSGGEWPEMRHLRSLLLTTCSPW